ncbi:hypothetical protein KI387_029163, partial [Taxus chinensis]
MNPHKLNPGDPCLWVNYNNMAAFLDGKFFVITFGKINAQVYDTKTGIWTSIYTLSGAESVRNCVAAFGRIYLFAMGNIKKFDLVHNRSTIVAELPRVLNNNGCATVWRDSLFVCPFNNGMKKSLVYYLFQPGLGTDRWAVKKWNGSVMPEGFPTHCFDCSVTT